MGEGGQKLFKIAGSIYGRPFTSFDAFSPPWIVRRQKDIDLITERTLPMFLVPDMLYPVMKTISFKKMSEISSHLYVCR